MGLARNIAKNTAVHIVGRAISTILALFVVGIMTRALGPDGFGGYSTIIAFLQFLGITVDFGLTLTANRMLGGLHNSPQPPLTSDATVGVRLETSDLRGGDVDNPPLKIRGGAGGVMNAASPLKSNFMPHRFGAWTE